MKHELKGTQTEKNLQAAFAGESQARNKYDYFAKVARNEGFHYIANVFEETALNEKQHAKDEFKKLGGLGDTKANLKEAWEGENYEVTKMYPEFAAKAEEEGFAEIASLFKQISKVEAEHRARYQHLLELVEQDKVFLRNAPVKWKCLKCGYVHEGNTPPAKCPTCQHPKEYYAPNDI
ncbi:MAG: rubrerythrin [uncultured bacterium]|nr:MAG: rubrerythrin [uncultured bacterium]HLD45421.1 rubrerythrin family protein [bacterium]